jgi:hypothetical protein
MGPSHRLGLRNGSVWVVAGATGIPDPRTLSGTGLDASPSVTDPFLHPGRLEHTKARLRRGIEPMIISTEWYCALYKRERPHVRVRDYHYVIL